MPDKKTIGAAKNDKREGKSASTQAGEFVHEEIKHVREGKHGARSTKQAIAIGLSKARRAGVDLPPPEKGKYSEETREKAKQELKWADKHPGAKPSPKRSRAGTERLKDEPKSTVSKAALSKQAKSVANKRTAAERSTIAKKAARTRKLKGG